MILLILSLVINMQEPLQTTGLLHIHDCHLWIESSIDTLKYDEYYEDVTLINNIKGVILKDTCWYGLDSVCVTFQEFINRVLHEKALITYIYIDTGERNQWSVLYNDIFIGYYLKEEKE